MSYEILFTNFIGTQRVIRAKNIETGEIVDFTLEDISSLPTDLQQTVQKHIHIINNGEFDYDGLLL